MFSNRGRRLSIASMFTLKLLSSDVCRYRLLITTCGLASRFNSITTRVFSSHSSRIPLISGRIFSPTNSAIRLISTARFSRYGISLMMICSRPRSSSSISTFPRTFT